MSLVPAVCGAALIGLLATGVSAQEATGPVSTAPEAAQQAAAVAAYWTPERMKAAKPMDLGGTDAAKAQTVPSLAATRAADAYPLLIPGWNPKSGAPKPTKASWIEFTPDTPQYKAMTSIAPQAFGSPPANPVDYANYGKFQRWTWYGRYLTFPTSTIGKMFFTQNGTDFVCSGTIVNLDMFITAGHCVSDGTSTFSTNVQICPSYNAGGVNPSRGCWAWAAATVSGSWHTSSDFDRDYACVVTQTTGTLFANNVGNMTGWAGLAFNWGTDLLMFSTGYPQGSPFAGTQIIFNAANEWYALNNGGDGAVSKYMGNDLTGGSSGGSWWMSIVHPTAEWPVVDDSSITDPPTASGDAFGPYVNGVNSHKRCLGSCFTPPNAGAGTFWDEMGSPNFTASGGDPNDVLDVYNSCISQGGN